MPIFTYFGVVSAVLIGLLFVADAKLERTSVPVIGSQVVELPGASHPHRPIGSTLVAEPAPAPDMNSAAVRTATPAAAKVAEASQAGEPARAEAAPKKKIVRRPQADDEKPHVAWRNNDAGSFGGGGFFGRF